MDLTARPFPARASAVAARGMVATSQPLATQAGLRALERGGNAVDAALAAAAVLCVVEPMSTGVGGDCFALVWRDGELTGLNASGRAPAAADPDALGTSVPARGPLSVTAPGAVAGWAALAERHGRLGLDQALEDAIDIAERGFAVTPVIAGYWAGAEAELALFDEARRVFLPAPRVGQIVQLPELAATLRTIASEGATGFYRGSVANAICAVTPLAPSDLAHDHVEWVEPLRKHYRGVDVCEIPPNGQGVAALQALGILAGLDHTGGRPLDRVHLQTEAMKLAFADAERHVHDGPLPAGYLDDAYLTERRALIDPRRAGNPASGPLRAEAPSTCAPSTSSATRAR